jgi:hypothetical protein
MCSQDTLKIIMLLLEPQELVMFSIAVPRTRSIFNDTQFIKNYIKQNTHPQRLRLDSKSFRTKLKGRDGYPIISASGETRDDYRYKCSVDINFKGNEKSFLVYNSRSSVFLEANFFPSDSLTAAEQGRASVWHMSIIVILKNASSNEYASLQQREKDVIQEVVDYAVY